VFNPKFFKSTKADVIFVYIAYSLRFVYLLLLIPFYARVLGAHGYGVILAALSLMQMMWLFVNWGFGIAGNREISTSNLNYYAYIFGKHFSARLILSVVALLLGFVAIQFSVVLVQNKFAGLTAILLGIISAFNLGWYFSGTKRPRDSVKLEVLGFILNLSLIFIFVREETDSLKAILCLFCSGIISLGVAHWWIRREITPTQLDFKQGLNLIKNTKSMFVYSSSAVLLGSSSTYLLSAFSTLTEVGYFGSAERLIAAGLSLMSPLGAIFIPKVTVLFNSDKYLAYQYVRKLLAFLMIIAFAILLVNYFAATPIIHLVFGENFNGSVEIFKCMSFIFPFSAASLVLSSYILIPLHHEKMLARIVILSATVNIILAIPLSNFLGGYGMAIARLSAEVFTFISLLITCYKLGIIGQLFNNGKANY